MSHHQRGVAHNVFGVNSIGAMLSCVQESHRIVGGFEQYFLRYSIGLSGL